MSPDPGQRQSINQEAPKRPTLAESQRWLGKQVWALPVLDLRSSEEIPSYGDDGLCD